MSSLEWFDTPSVHKDTLKRVFIVGCPCYFCPPNMSCFLGLLRDFSSAVQSSDSFFSQVPHVFRLKCLTSAGTMSYIRFIHLDISFGNLKFLVVGDRCRQTEASGLVHAGLTTKRRQAEDASSCMFIKLYCPLYSKLVKEIWENPASY